MNKYLNIILVATVILLNGCATTEGFKKNMDSWIGASEITLIRQQGAPNTTYESGGVKFLVYYYSYTSSDYYSTTYYYGSASTVNYGGNTYTCEITYELYNDIIQNVRWKGNNCRAVGPED